MDTDMNSSKNEGERLKESFENAVKIYYTSLNCNPNTIEKNAWPIEEVNHIIDQIKIYHKGSCKSQTEQEQYRRLAKKYNIVKEKDFDTLIIKPQSKDDEEVKIAPIQKIYDILEEAHLVTGHGSTDEMTKMLKVKKYNIPSIIVQTFRRYCQSCASSELKYSIFESRSRVELLDMQETPDGEFKWILFYRDYFSNILILRPLITNSIDEITLNLLTIFLEFGCPLILHSELGHDFTTALIEKTESAWLSPCKILEPTPEGYSMSECDKKLVAYIHTTLAYWMSVNDTINWSIGVHFIQYQYNSVQQALRHAPFKVLIDREQELKTFGEHLFKMKTEDDLKLYYYFELMEKKGLSYCKYYATQVKRTITSIKQKDKSATNATIFQYLNMQGNNNPQKILWLTKTYNKLNLKKKTRNTNEPTVAEHLGLLTNMENEVSHKSSPNKDYENFELCAFNEKTSKDVTDLGLNIKKCVTPNITQPTKYDESETNTETSINKNVVEIVNEMDCRNLIADRTHPNNEKNSHTLKPLDKIKTMMVHDETIDKSINNKTVHESELNYEKSETNDTSQNEKSTNLIDSYMNDKITHLKDDQMPPTQKIEAMEHEESFGVNNKSGTNPDRSADENICLIDNDIDCRRPVANATHPKSNKTPPSQLFKEIETMEHEVILEMNNKYENNPDISDKTPAHQLFEEVETMEHEESFEVNNKTETNRDTSENENIDSIDNDIDRRRLVANTTHPISNKTPAHQLYEEIETIEHEKSFEVNNKAGTNRDTSENENISSSDNDIDCRRSVVNTTHPKSNKTPPSQLFEEIETMEHEESLEMNNKYGNNPDTSEMENIGSIDNNVDCRRPVVNTTHPKSNKTPPSQLFEEIETMEHEESLEMNNKYGNNPDTSEMENIGLIDNDVDCKRPVANTTHSKSNKTPAYQLFEEIEAMEHEESFEVNNKSGTNPDTSENENIGSIDNDIDCRRLVADTTHSKSNKTLAFQLFEEIETMEHEEFVDTEKLNCEKPKTDNELSQNDKISVYDNETVCRRPMVFRTYSRSKKTQSVLKPHEKIETMAEEYSIETSRFEKMLKRIKNEMAHDPKLDKEKLETNYRILKKNDGNPPSLKPLEEETIVHEELIKNSRCRQTLMKIKNKMADPEASTTYLNSEKTQTTLKIFDDIETIMVPDDSSEEKCTLMLRNIKNEMTLERSLNHEKSEPDENSIKSKHIVTATDKMDSNLAQVEAFRKINCDDIKDENIINFNANNIEPSSRNTSINTINEIQKVNNLNEEKMQLPPLDVILDYWIS